MLLTSSIQKTNRQASLGTWTFSPSLTKFVLFHHCNPVPGTVWHIVVTRENTASQMQKVGGSCLSLTGLHGLSAGWCADDHRSGCPRVPRQAQAAPRLGGQREGHALSRSAPHMLPVPGLPLGAGMKPYNCPTTKGEALMEEFTGSEALTKIHGRPLYMFPQ